MSPVFWPVTVTVAVKSTGGRTTFWLGMTKATLYVWVTEHDWVVTLTITLGVLSPKLNTHVKGPVPPV